MGSAIPSNFSISLFWFYRLLQVWDSKDWPNFQKRVRRKRLKMILIIFSLVSGLLLLFLILGHKEIEHFLKGKGIDFPEFNHLSVNLYHAKRFLFYLALFFLLLRVGIEVKWKNWAKVLLVFFLTADLFGNMGFYGKEKTSDYFRKTQILEMISQIKAISEFFQQQDHFNGYSYFSSQCNSFGYLKRKTFTHPWICFTGCITYGESMWFRLKRVDDLYKAFTMLPLSPQPISLTFME